MIELRDCLIGIHRRRRREDRREVDRRRCDEIRVNDGGCRRQGNQEQPTEFGESHGPIPLKITINSTYSGPRVTTVIASSGNASITFLRESAVRPASVAVSCSSERYSLL